MCSLSISQPLYITRSCAPLPQRNLLELSRTHADLCVKLILCRSSCQSYADLRAGSRIMPVFTPDSCRSFCLDFSSAFTHLSQSSYRTSLSPLMPSPHFHRRNHHSCHCIISVEITTIYSTHQNQN